jgi:hypothetical protein
MLNGILYCLCFVAVIFTGAGRTAMRAVGR